MTHDLIGSLDEAIANITRYQTEIQRDPRLAGLMKQVHAWYAVRSDDETWLFAPSKFIGYANNTASDYLSGADGRNGGRTEAVLKGWFDVVPPDSRRGIQLDGTLRKFLKIHGHAGPRKDARICIPKQILAARADEVDGTVQDRVHIDAAICGGRPHIRGTRVRVSDILDMLAHGVSPADILTDYPYLGEADLNAALAFGAAASGHRIILTA